VRYAYWFAVVFAIGTEISAIAVFMKYWFPAVPGWYWVIGFSALLIAVNMASVTLYGSVEYAFSLLMIAAIIVFVLLGAYLVWSASRSSCYSRSPTRCITGTGARAERVRGGGVSAAGPARAICGSAYAIALRPHVVASGRTDLTMLRLR
jgi:L-asparagine transporter-like permease